MQARFSFNSKAAQETYAEAWDKRDPWRMLKKNVSFAASRKGTKVCDKMNGGGRRSTFGDPDPYRDACDPIQK